MHACGMVRHGCVDLTWSVLRPTSRRTPDRTLKIRHGDANVTWVDGRIIDTSLLRSNRTPKANSQPPPAIGANEVQHADLSLCVPPCRRISRFFVLSDRIAQEPAIETPDLCQNPQEDIISYFYS